MTPSEALSRLNEAPELSGRRTIPFDYAFRYELTGRPGNVINQTVTVSIEATFVAVSVGYGFLPKVTPIFFGPKPPAIIITAVPAKQSLRNIDLGALLDALEAKLRETSRLLRRENAAEAVFKNGIKLNPDIAEFALQNGGSIPLDASALASLFQAVAPAPENVQFLYSIFDEGSGREFQSEPILNIAGLGISNGDRPFRYFGQPIAFAPQSTIRMEVREISDFQGELHVALHGYKVLGRAGTPTGVVQRRIGRMPRR
jgi:hypothetical protein